MRVQMSYTVPVALLKDPNFWQPFSTAYIEHVHFIAVNVTS